MAPFILKFKGNKSFVAFHNMNDGESLTKTWKVCTKVAAHLEQGQRLENLSWRLWHLHNIMVETDNAKSKREFKKLSRTMGDKLDREKGKNIEELRAPGFKRTESSDKMRRRAEEIERLRDESHSGGGMRRMQFTFSLDTPSPTPASPQKAKITVSTHHGKKPPVFKEPALKADVTKQGSTKLKTIEKKTDDKAASANSTPANPEKGRGRRADEAPTIPPTSQTIPLGPEPTSPTLSGTPVASQAQEPSVRLPGLFSSNFGPTAMLRPSPTFGPSLSYGEDVTMSYAGPSIPSDGGMGVSRPTIELPLDELLEVDGENAESWTEILAGLEASKNNEDRSKEQGGRTAPTENNTVGIQADDHKPFGLDFDLAKMMQADGVITAALSADPPAQQQGYSPAAFYTKPPSELASQRQAPTTTLNPMAMHHTPPAAKVNNGSRSTNATTNNGKEAANGKGAPGATVAPMSAPAGQKTECSNCGATHTPLWRRGLNDELNCNACGLYCKLHKRPRPKSMRAPHGDNTRNNNSHSRNVDSDAVGAQCFNCHTTATPLWRKDDEGKTVCNACGLYYKLHGTNRPLSMKSDVIRKRSRHEIKRAGLPGSSSETPSASPGASRRASPACAASPPSAPEEEHREEEQKTPQVSYEHASKPTQADKTTDDSSPKDKSSSVSSQDQNDNANGSSTSYSGHFPGPYHPDYLYHMSTGSDLHPIQTGDSSDYGVEDRGNKRRRLSSASHDSSSTPTDPPPSATSLKSSQTKSPTSSPAFPSYGLPYPVYNYQGFSDAIESWVTGRIHPPMTLPDDAPMEFLHPPMAVPETVSQPSSSGPSRPSYPYLRPPMLPVEEAALTYLHPPMLPQANSPIVGYTHPPMLPSYWSSEHTAAYADSSTNAHENSNNMEMFDSMMNSIE